MPFTEEPAPLSRQRRHGVLPAPVQAQSAGLAFPACCWCKCRATLKTSSGVLPLKLCARQNAGIYYHAKLLREETIFGVYALLAVHRRASMRYYPNTCVGILRPCPRR